MAGQLFLTEQHIHTKDKTHGHGKNAVRHAGCNVKQGPHKIGGNLCRFGQKGSPIDGEGVDLILGHIVFFQKTDNLV